ncbi:hypothetical protein AGDE_16585 [Angomonas deanei]|uniref:Leucine Rich repeat n=1 Tax=Angomonas deanei TaxID=59799 RepID=A0A7G2CGT5_9TRYP|nr:hypothetical protein AGDE_16585 [Angomonas deanei]CAD2219088.1 hypothetical protein, conserved [Angomonas deanei]|eukprot:EPY16826.1 hypothetical protein AGDE_16585 [Angomonas deanei]
MLLLQKTDEIILGECVLTSLESLKGLERLTKVTFWECRDSLHCRGVTSQDALGELRNLRVVMLRGVKLTNVDSLKDCPMLEFATASHSKTLISLDGLFGLHRLKSVNVGSTSITSIRSLSACVSLEEVIVSGCRHLESGKHKYHQYSGSSRVRRVGSRPTQQV